MRRAGRGRTQPVRVRVHVTTAVHNSARSIRWRANDTRMVLRFSILPHSQRRNGAGQVTNEPPRYNWRGLPVRFAIFCAIAALMFVLFERAA